MMTEKTKLLFYSVKYVFGAIFVFDFKVKGSRALIGSIKFDVFYVGEQYVQRRLIHKHESALQWVEEAAVGFA